MVFSSSIFLLFFLPLVILGYYLVNKKIRIHFLLLASLCFYAWGEPKYVLLMLFSIVINYSFGILIYINDTKKNFAKFFLIFAILCNLGILFYFKYFNFVLGNIHKFIGSDYVLRNIILPIGISFYLFQGMSYLIDLYWKRIEVQKDPFKLAFYIAFFPQLMAGPIIRYSDICEEINNRSESLEDFSAGAKRFIIGLGKKVLIADNIALTPDIIFSNPATENTPAIAWLGAICFAFQIYFDFSGYSCMAIGLARMFGFKFKENFNYPYISKTITEFWSRWNISLGLWFRDYVYIPIGGNRKGNVYLNTLILFFIVGLWHGANFNCILWGVYFGIILVIERFFNLREIKNKCFIPIRHIIFIVLYLLSIPIFRSPNIIYCMQYIGIMFGFIKPENIGFHLSYYLNADLIILLCSSIIASTPISKLLLNFLNTAVYRISTSVLCLFLLFVCIVFVTASSFTAFIYFRF